MTRKRKQFLTFIARLLLAGFAAHAQDGAKEKFAQAQEQNAAQLTPVRIRPHLAPPGN